MTKKTPKPMSPDDADEFVRLKKALKTAHAQTFSSIPEYRDHLKHYVIRQYAPGGRAELNEFNFRDEAAAEQAGAYVEAQR